MTPKTTVLDFSEKKQGGTNRLDVGIYAKLKRSLRYSSPFIKRISAVLISLLLILFIENIILALQIDGQTKFLCTAVVSGSALLFILAEGFSLACWLMGSLLAISPTIVRNVFYSLRQFIDCIPSMLGAGLIAVSIYSSPISGSLSEKPISLIVALFVIFAGPYISISMHRTLSLMEKDFYVNAKLQGGLGVSSFVRDVLPQTVLILPKYRNNFVTLLISIDLFIGTLGYDSAGDIFTIGSIIKKGISTVGASPLNIMIPGVICITLIALANRKVSHMDG